MRKYRAQKYRELKGSKGRCGKVQGAMGKYGARWRSTGLGEEVQGTRRMYRAQKYRALKGSTGRCGKVQGTVRKYRARWRSTGHGKKI